MSLGFEANDGQVDAQVRYLARGPGYTLWLTQSEAVLGMHGSRPNPRLVNGVADTLARDQVPTSVLRIALLGANPDPQLTGLDKLPGIANYFLGNDHSRWRVGVPIYGKVKYEGIYSGIDLVYYWNQGQLEYDFIVAPGADPGQIRLEVTGNENIRQDEEGTLQLTTASGEIRLRRPQVYQVIDGTRHDIAARYVLPKEGSAGMSRSGIGIQLAAYDADLPLVIDPVITYSTYLGGTSVDEGLGIAVDGAGNIYVSGTTSSPLFPTNPVQPKPGAIEDAFVTKISANGASLVYSTYLGGDAIDVGSAVAVDVNGNAYVTGSTKSTDFPRVAAIQNSRNGEQDAFVTKLSSNGTIVYSTYLGSGSGPGGLDGGNGIAVDGNGQAYVAGFTRVPNFAACSGTCVRTALGPGGLDDVFVAKFNAAGSGLIYTTFIGGTNSEIPNGIAIDGSQNVYVTGPTNSDNTHNFPTQSAFQANYGGGDSDAFVTKLAASGASLVFSTYFGGPGVDSGGRIAVDSSGNVYLTGVTVSSPFPLSNAFQPNPGGGDGDAFVAKFTPSGTTLAYSSYLGGTLGDNGLGIGVDTAGNAYVFGFTGSPDFPTTPGAFQTGRSGLNDMFLTKVSRGGTRLYSTYLGGTDSEIASVGNLAMDAAGNAYVTGGTVSNDFPRVSPFQNDYAGNRDAFVTKFDLAVNLFNISTRGQVGVGNDIMFGGFVIRPSGGTPKRLYMRAWGPTLVPFGLPNALSNPFLRVVNQDNGQEIATNNNYLTPPVCVPGIVCESTAQIQGTGFDPCLSGTANCQNEPVLIITLPPNNGGYVAQVSGEGGVTGIATVEIDEFDGSPIPTKLFNISTRGPVGTGNNIMFGGFVVRPSVGSSKRLYVRAWGPTLTNFGVTGALPDPVVFIINQDTGQPMASNDNWQTPASCAPGVTCESTAQIVGTGFDPCTNPGGPNCDKEAVLIVTLPPNNGGYVAQVSGAGGVTGIATVEIDEF